MTRTALVWKRQHQLWTLMLPLMFHRSLDEDCLFRKLRHRMLVLSNIEGFVQVQLQQRYFDDNF